MKDVIVILMTLGFFGLCVAYVALCDRIVGPEPDPEPVVADDDARSVGADGPSVATTVGSAR